MNAVPKLVLSRTLADASAWANSQIVDGDLVETVEGEHRDVIITGSLSVVHSLMARDLVDEYRLLIFPTVLGTGNQLFPDGRPPGTWKAGRSNRPVPPSSRGTESRHSDRSWCLAQENLADAVAACEAALQRRELTPKQQGRYNGFNGLAYVLVAGGSTREALAPGLGGGAAGGRWRRSG
jgi:hypothetical protein